MSNHITASVEFYFKGEKIVASIELDLNAQLENNDELPNLYPLLANAIGIGPHTYEYEMMEAETIVFSNPKGMVAEHVIDGTLDIHKFKHILQQKNIIIKLKSIAAQNMAITDLENNPDLMKSLLDAYQLGKNLNSDNS